MKGRRYAAEALQALVAITDPLPRTINFYRQHELPFGVFSNFFRTEIIINGMTFPTTEHYFQAMKFAPTNAQCFNDVVNCATPAEAAAIGRDRSLPRRSDWQEIKVNVMFDAITAKFLQYDDLFKILMKTSGSILVEKSQNDYYWGIGADGSGKNMLGVLLMKLRDSIQNVAEVVCEKNADAFKAERNKINVALRETGVNGLRSNSGSATDAAFGFGLATPKPSDQKTAETTNKNDFQNDDDDEIKTTATTAIQKKKKNRLQ